MSAPLFCPMCDLNINVFGEKLSRHQALVLKWREGESAELKAARTEIAAKDREILDLTRELERDGWKTRCLAAREDINCFKAEIAALKAALEEIAHPTYGPGKPRPPMVVAREALAKRKGGG